jgi:hypothetical protein
LKSSVNDCLSFLSDNEEDEEMVSDEEVDSAEVSKYR